MGYIVNLFTVYDACCVHCGIKMCCTIACEQVTKINCKLTVDWVIEFLNNVCYIKVTSHLIVNLSYVLKA